jgi:hypothetical protein
VLDWGNSAPEGLSDGGELVRYLDPALGSHNYSKTRAFDDRITSTRITTCSGRKLSVGYLLVLFSCYLCVLLF